ncbi:MULTISPECIES: helix-turn-helix transcriptional regulator [unclassified Nocardiopsis]|uniref:helix-turn-helix transcriptional regulator n=1 Tax=Nocardiopsis TaxID=2013 RepID=UPI00387AB630
MGTGVRADARPGRGPALSAEELWAVGSELIHRADGDGFARLVAGQRRRSGREPEYRESVALALLGRSAWARERWSEAIRVFRQALPSVDHPADEAPPSCLWTRVALVEALVENGELEEAGRRLAPVAASRHGESPEVLRVSALLSTARGDLDRAREEADHAVVAARSAGGTARAWCLRDRARLFVRLGYTGPARADLERARSMAAGDAPLLSRVARDARACAPGKAAEPLTSAETRVFERMVAGESNIEIANALFVSVRTVESHVSAIMRKTGETSRLRLVARFAREGAPSGAR